MTNLFSIQWIRFRVRSLLGYPPGLQLGTISRPTAEQQPVGREAWDTGGSAFDILIFPRFNSVPKSSIVPSISKAEET